MTEAVCGANDNLFESNLVEHVAFECDDTGAFYTCGQQGTAFVNRGNVLRNNTFRHVRMQDHTNLGYPSVQAIYLDDQMSGWSVVNNTVTDAQMGLMVGGGRDNIVIGNRFEDCDVAVHVDARGSSNEHADCVGVDSENYRAVMDVPQWAKYGLAPPAHNCVPSNVTVAHNCWVNCEQFFDGKGGAPPGKTMAEQEASMKAWFSTASGNVPCVAK